MYLVGRIQYYRTPIGARRPHSGGYFLKLLSNLDELWIHYSETDEPEFSEKQIVSNFIDNVSDSSKSLLHDPYLPLPFANLNIPNGMRKAHGLKGARSENKLSASTVEDASQESQQITQKVGAHMDDYRTQRVTATDLKNGRIRIPSTNTAKTKSLFPREKERVTVILRGETFHCSYDPRMGPDKQRSGIIQIGSNLRKHVYEDEVLTVSRGADGEYVIG